MARLYLDNDVRVAYASALSSYGHDVVHVKDFRTFNESDDYHLSAATRLNRVLVTHNRDDFLHLHRAWLRWTSEWGVARDHGGILIVPQEQFADIASRVHEFFHQALPTASSLYLYDRHLGWTEVH